MNPREMVSRIKGWGRHEENAKKANMGVDVVKLGVGISWFVALGRFCSVVSKFFKTHTSELFLLSVFINIISWVISTVDFSKAQNRNLGKIANYVYSSFYVAFYIATVAVFVAVGLLAGGVMLAISMFMDPLVNLGRAIYFGIKALRENDPEKKHYFKTRALTHDFFALAGIFISSVFLVLMVLTAMPLLPAVLLGIAGIGVMVGMAMIIPKIVAKAMGPVPAPSVEIESKPDLIQMDVEDNSAEQSLLQSTLPARSYYNHSVTKLPASLNALRNKIDNLIHKIEADDTRDKRERKLLGWFQNAKRQDKIGALEFLKTLINHLEYGQLIPDSADESNPYNLMGCTFTYTDKIDLCDQIKKLVTDKEMYPQAFQSTYMEVGETEACFNQLLLCIMTNSKLLYKNNILDETEDTNKRLSYAF